MTRRSVLITGCSQGGIGYSLAKEYRSKGLQVFATARRMEAMAGLAELGIELVQLDVTSIESIRKAREVVQEKTGGKLDILINNAGAGTTGPAIEFPIEQTASIFATNFFGLIQTTQEFFPLLNASSAGCIVNIGSTAGVYGFPFGSSYAASKAALHSWSDLLGIELAPFKIKVITVRLGGVISVGARRFVTNTIPMSDNSIYKPAEATFHEATNPEKMGAISSEVFARQFVPKTLQANPPRRLLIGGGAKLLAFFVAILPHSWIDAMVGRMFGIQKLTA